MTVEERRRPAGCRRREVGHQCDRWPPECPEEPGATGLLRTRVQVSPGEVGRCAVWRKELDVCIHQNSVVRARLRDDAAVMPEFVEAWFNSGPGNTYIREQATTTSGLYHIGAGKLGGAPVPLPDMSIQRRLVGSLSAARSSTADALQTARAQHAAARTRLEIEVFGSPATEHPKEDNEDEAED